MYWDKRFHHPHVIHIIHSKWKVIIWIIGEQRQLHSILFEDNITSLIWIDWMRVSVSVPICQCIWMFHTVYSNNYNELSS